MEPNKIAVLLEKYFDGTTTIDQEKQLKNYFCSEGVAQHLQQYKYIFQYFENEKQVVFDKKIQIKSQTKIVWFSMVATVILLFGLAAFYLINHNSASPEKSFGSFQNPEIAFEETQKALQMISNNVNVGINSVAYINEYQNTKNKIFVE